MAEILVCSTPVHGHVSPLLGIARALADRGHRVTMLTGTRFRAQVEEAGVSFRGLSGIADFDDRDVPSYLPDQDRYTGLARAQYDIQTIFVRTIPAQLAATEAALAAVAPDAVLVDGMFAGVGPLLVDAGRARPPILAAGVTPLAQASRDVAPMGLALHPSSSLPGRTRNRLLRFIAHRVLFRPTQRVAEQMFTEVGAPPLTTSIMDFSAAFDRFLQLGPESFEYPRSDLAPNTVFVGPVPSGPSPAPTPDWWSDLDGSRPIIHVTQGTIDNRDLSRLILPTITALADLDVLVVVTMGGRDPSELLAVIRGPLPSNVRVADYLPYDRLLPRTDLVISNGGFGGVQAALTAGVPLVVAGGTEDKPEVAARVAWSGVGIDLKTGTPAAAAIRRAVDAVLADPVYRGRARRMAADIAGYPTIDLIEGELLAAIRGAA